MRRAIRLPSFQEPKMGGSRHVVSKFRPLGPIFLCFRVSIFESQQIRAVCRPLANAQNTPQNPVQDRFLNYRRIGAMRRMNDFSKIDLCLRSANILKFVHLKFLGPETEGKWHARGRIRDVRWRAAAFEIRRRAPFGARAHGSTYRRPSLRSG